jgi:hypothetical protein
MLAMFKNDTVSGSLRLTRHRVIDSASATTRANAETVVIFSAGIMWKE